MSAALGLYRLQQVDSQIDQIQARQKMIRETLENDLSLRAATEHFTAAENVYKEAARVLKQCEGEVEKQRIKIEQIESSLYSGLVHNPKELQDLQKDVASLKRHRETLEERQLEAMLAVEDAERELNKTKTELQRTQAIVKDQNQDLTKENESLDKDLERLSFEHKAVMSNITEQALMPYEQLRKKRRGIAVSTITDGSCAACGTTLTPALQQSARSTTQLINCPTCGRILFAN